MFGIFGSSDPPKATESKPITETSSTTSSTSSSILISSCSETFKNSDFVSNFFEKLNNIEKRLDKLDDSKYNIDMEKLCEHNYIIKCGKKICIKCDKITEIATTYQDQGMGHRWHIGENGTHKIILFCDSCMKTDYIVKMLDS